MSDTASEITNASTIERPAPRRIASNTFDSFVPDSQLSTWTQEDNKTKAEKNSVVKAVKGVGRKNKGGAKEEKEGLIRRLTDRKW